MLAVRVTLRKTSQYLPNQTVAGRNLQIIYRNHQQRSFTLQSLLEKIGGSSGEKQLRILEAAAREAPKNPEVQYAFLSELGKKNPKLVVNWFESGNFAVNSDVAKAYIAALAKLGRLDRLELSEVYKKVTQSASGKQFNKRTLSGDVASEITAARAPLISSFGESSAGVSPSKPLYVMTATSWRDSARSILTFGIVTFVIACGVMSLAEGSLSSKMMPGKSVRMAEESDKRFSDVLGIDEAKAELQEIVMYLKDPTKFTRLGGTLPKGILLMGPPGTGKTLLARAVAGEAGVPFFFASGSEFEEMFVGVGARRIRDLFKEAKARSPCIIFIDEIDAIGGRRTRADQQYAKMTLNQLLVEMDGFQQNSGVIVIAATNFAESLDNALVRPGRFDSRVSVPLPDILGRQQILELYGSKSKIDSSVDLKVLARGTPGMSGADLGNLINQAALKASSDGLKAISMDTLEWAKDKILMGAERKTAVISPETARMTAYHEGGHALVALKTAGADPIHKATIMPRGHSLGMVMQLPEGDQTSYSRKQMLAKLDVLMGGRVAEELIFGYDNVTNGASSDIQMATRLATSMVTRWGMSDALGIVAYGDKASGPTKDKIDTEIRKIIEESYARAKDILTTNRDELETLAKSLLEYETLSGAEIQEVLAGRPPTHRATKQVSTVNKRSALANKLGAIKANAPKPVIPSVNDS